MHLQAVESLRAVAGHHSQASMEEHFVPMIKRLASGTCNQWIRCLQICPSSIPLVPIPFHLFSLCSRGVVYIKDVCVWSLLSGVFPVHRHHSRRSETVRIFQFERLLVS